MSKPRCNSNAQRSVLSSFPGPRQQTTHHSLIGQISSRKIALFISALSTSPLLFRQGGDLPVRLLVRSVMLGMGHRRTVEPCRRLAFSTPGNPPAARPFLAYVPRPGVLLL